MPHTKRNEPLNKKKSFFGRLDLVNTAFLLLTPLIGIGGTIALAVYGVIPWATLVLALVMAICTGIGITGGYHRLFAHKSYDAKGFYKFFMLFFGAAAFENSALRWASDHRNHHKFVDTDQDPYNIKRGFFWAHMGWVMVKYDNKHRYDNVADLQADPLVRFQDRHYVMLGVLVGFVIPMALASLWGDALGGLIVAGFLRTVLNHHFTFSINSFAHLFGRQPYSDQNSSRDSWFLALFTYGEGYHNYHHKFPSDYRNGIRAFHWDPTKWLVRISERIGQTYNLRRMPNETILRARLKMDEKRVLLKLQHHPAVSHELVVNTRTRIEDAYRHLRTLTAEYRRLKEQKMTAFSLQMGAVNERITALKADLRRAQERFKAAKAEWARLCGQTGVRAARPLYS
jgi:stearoyl-CoA desaturase (Delta-9 desaturase)